jgi:hypothetical protein
MLPSWPLGDPLVLVVAFLVLCPVVLWFVSGGRTGSLLSGVLRLAGALFQAPLRYLRSSATRIVGYARSSRHSDPADKQYLVGTLLMITNAILLLAAVGILAASAAGAWYALYPPWISAQRLSMDSNAKGLEERLPRVRKELEELTVKLGAETDAERIARELRERAGQRRETLQREAQGLDQANQQEWRSLKTYLARMENRAVPEWELRNAEAQVKPFLARIRDAALGQALSAYFTSWTELRRDEQRLAQQERNNPRAALERNSSRFPVWPGTRSLVHRGGTTMRGCSDGRVDPPSPLHGSATRARQASQRHPLP